MGMDENWIDPDVIERVQKLEAVLREILEFAEVAVNLAASEWDSTAEHHRETNRQIEILRAAKILLGYPPTVARAVEGE